MKKFAKKIIGMFIKELMEKIQSDEFEITLAQKLASVSNLPKMDESEEIEFYKNIIDATTDTVAEVMGGEAD
jgi:hypothetical protein|tara:strand:+ start:567 stop:782 length:216 start_codon:yes stop_codon:yes gene_type:complete